LEPWIAILISAGVGATVSLFVSVFVARGNRKHAYYDKLISTISDHNWSLLTNSLSPGLPVTNISRETSIVCYQHINLLFLIWLNRTYAKRDGTMKGWKRWADAVVKGSKLPENKCFRDCYRQILSHGDGYPNLFITWLANEMSFSVADFHEVDS